MSAPASILLVDDSSDDVAIAMRALRRAGVPAEVHTARSGREALEVLHLWGSPADGQPLEPTVIFLDLKMPQVDGFEVLERLRRSERTRAIPVVVMSWSDRTEDIRRSYELGANSYLVKRFDRREPGAELVEAASYWMRHDRPAG